MGVSGQPIGSTADQGTLLLRPWAESDAPGLREAIDEDVSHLKPWLSWTFAEPATLEQTQARLRGYVEEFRSGKAYRYAIAAPDRPTHILGGVGLNHRVGPAAHDVGYWVRRSVARQGIAAAAVSALAVHAFSRTSIERLVIQCDVANQASASMARALGFELIGQVMTTNPDGSPRPVLQFELARSSYELSYAQTFRVRSRRVRFVAAIAAL